MPSIDMPLERLRQYRPALYRQSDFDQFWKTTVDEAVRQPLNTVELKPYDLPTGNVECFPATIRRFQRRPTERDGYLRPKSARQTSGSLHVSRL